MGPTSKRRRSDSEAGQQGPDKRRGQEGACLEGGTAAAAAGASAGNGNGQGPSQPTAAAAAGAMGSRRRRARQPQGQGQNTDTLWLCPFCNKLLSSKGSLTQHVGNKHEGDGKCRGEAMKSYLQNMDRWLCGRCYYTAASRTRNCRRCGDSTETGVSGEAPARPTFRWPTEGITMEN